MSTIDAEFARLARRQWFHARFCIRNRGAFMDCALRLFRFGLSINRDHRSPKAQVAVSAFGRSAACMVWVPF